MFDRHIEFCNKLIDRFDRYISHIENNISNRSDNYLDRLPRNEVILQSDLKEFFNSIDEILTEVYGKDSSEYAKWVNIKNNHFEIDRERAYNNASFREKQGGYYGNILNSELSQVQRDCVNQTVKLLADLQVKYQLQQDQKNKQMSVTHIHGNPVYQTFYKKVENAVGIGNINITSNQKENVAEVALKIQQILDKLEKDYPTETLTQQAFVVEKTIQQIEGDRNCKQKVISAVKAMGIEAFMELIDNPVANVLRAGIEDWIEK